MLFNRTAVIPVWLLAVGLLALFGSPITFPHGVVVLLAGAVALTILRVLWQNPAPRVATVTAPRPLLTTHSPTDFVANSWPNSGFRNIKIRNGSARGR